MKQLVTLFLIFFSIQAYSATIYVNDNASGANTGTSWADAFTSFQSGLNAAQSGDQIWVASGTYKPGYDYGLGLGTRGNHFRMKPGVAIYGGFAGTETAVSQRTNYGASGENETILSGDINGDDVVSGSGATLAITNNTENCYHVFYLPDGLGLTNTAVLDGFTISGGNANQITNYLPHNSGGAIYNDSNSPTINNCTIIGNNSYLGGVVFNYSDCTPLFSNCLITKNSTDQNGAIYNAFSNPTISNCLFTKNKCPSEGAMFNHFSTVIIRNCKFSENYSRSGVGAIENFYSTTTISNCLFIANIGFYNGAMSNSNSNVTINNSTFTRNIAIFSNGHGGALTNSSSTTIINNSIIWDNNSPNGKQIYNYSGTTTLNYCCYSNRIGDLTISEGEINTSNNNITSIPKFVNPAEGDYRICGTSPCIDAGNNSYCNETTDIRGLGFGRKLDKANGAPGTIDIGAYEYRQGTDPATMTIHVKHNATGLNNGSNWADAFTSFQAALDIAVSGDKIWVAKGTYKPSYDYGLGLGARGNHFRMKQGVDIYGGFAGTETSIDQRTDFGLGGINETILSGDINGDDVVSGSGATLNITNNTENCYHLFYHPEGLGLTNTDTLNGFTICGGNADANEPHNAGGAIHNYLNAPTISNCTVANNEAVNGGGIYNYRNATKIINSIFKNNKSMINGGAMYNYYVATPSTINCTFIGNSADNGGAICNYAYSDLDMMNCSIYGNSANNGAAISISWGSEAKLSNCILNDNIAIKGGALFSYDNAYYQLSNCTLTKNSANEGGALYNDFESSAIIRNSILCNNNALSGKDIYTHSSDVNLSNSLYSNGADIFYTNDGSIDISNSIISSNPQFLNPLAGDFRILGSSPCVDAGSNTFIAEPYPELTTDIRGVGFSRSLNKLTGDTGTVDIGAYEYHLGIDPKGPPSSQSSNIKFSNITRTGMTVSWTRGNGEASLLLGKEQYRIAATPLTDWSIYNEASPTFTTAPTVGGAKLLYNGDDANPSVMITGLTKYKLIYFKVCEYNDILIPHYLQTENTGNPASRWTLRRDGLMAEDLTIDAEYAYPNPAINSISTTLDVFEEGRITATMYDIEGRTVATLYDKHHNFGTYELNFDISTIPSGVYHLVISKGSEAIVYPVSVVR